MSGSQGHSTVLARLNPKQIEGAAVLRSSIALFQFRGLMRHAVAVGLRMDDPTAGVHGPKLRSAGFYSWTEEDIAAFEAKHPLGSRARLALALLLYSAQRRADVIRLGRQHLRDGLLHVRQSKTGKPLAIPLHPELRAVLDTTPSEHLTFLVTMSGKPFHADAFTHWFKRKCVEAGLPARASVHGLRKAACRRLAEAGCSASVIAAISGHATLREVSRYTAAADQLRLTTAQLPTDWTVPRKHGYSRTTPLMRRRAIFGFSPFVAPSASLGLLYRIFPQRPPPGPSRVSLCTLAQAYAPEITI